MPITLSSNANNATCLITVHTARKHSAEFDQASTPNANKRSTDSTNKQAAPTREGKHETDKAHLQLKNLPLKNFSRGGGGGELREKNKKGLFFFAF